MGAKYNTKKRATVFGLVNWSTGDVKDGAQDTIVGYTFNTCSITEDH
jgi:hypothetical protein